MTLIETLLLVIAIFLGGLIVKSYLPAYAAEKGKNLATKEDIAELTKIAKEIEAKISNEVWDRQKHWELRREVIFDAIKAATKAHNGVGSLAIFLKTTPSRSDNYAERLEKVISEVTSTNETITEHFILVRLACGKNAYDKYMDFADQIHKSFDRLAVGDIADYEEKSYPLNLAYRNLVDAFREDLGFPSMLANSVSVVPPASAN